MTEKRDRKRLSVNKSNRDINFEVKGRKMEVRALTFVTLLFMENTGK